MARKALSCWKSKLRSRDEGDEEPIELLDVHCLAALATLEEFRETIEFGVG
jgi:hypothetical protein